MNWRLFIAFHLGSDIRERLSQMQAALRTADTSHAVRWVDPASIHLTLRFLGDTTEEAVPALVAALGSGTRGRRALQLGLGSLGGFPNLNRPRVIWVGLDGDLEGLAELQRRVESAVEASGWEAEGRPYQPHLTLGRVRDPGGLFDPRLTQAIASLRTAVGQSQLVCLALIRSHLGPRGSRYEDIATWELDP